MRKEKKFQPPVFLFLLFILALGLNFFSPQTQIIPAPFRFLGMILMFLGGGINFWVDQLLKKEKTTVKPFEKPSVLITRGPFQISRHPMYLGFVLILTGLALVLKNLVCFFSPLVMFWVLNRFFIPHEEKNLKKVFGEKYQTYQRKVRRWL